MENDLASTSLMIIDKFVLVVHNADQLIGTKPFFMLAVHLAASFCFFPFAVCDFLELLMNCNSRDS